MAEGMAKDGGAGVPDPSSPVPRLPAGRHGLPREFIVQNQRERIVTAMVETVAERGYNETTVGHVTKAAAVSRRTFYEHFPDKEACFLAAYEMVLNHILTAMRVAAEAFEQWSQKVRAALATMLRFFAGAPELARICMIEPAIAGGALAARHRASMEGFAEILRAGRPEVEGERPLPDAIEETLVGGVVSLIVKEINAGNTEQLEKMLPDLVELILSPYLGAKEAARLARA